MDNLKQKTLTITSKGFCEPDRIRTYDRLLRREVLYPAELRALTFCNNGRKNNHFIRIPLNNLLFLNIAIP